MTFCLLGRSCGLCSRRRLELSGVLSEDELAAMFDERRSCKCGHYRPAHGAGFRGRDCDLCGCHTWRPADGGPLDGPLRIVGA